MNRFTCPVCGFLLKYPADNFNTCPSCGVEFGADTISSSIVELRAAWAARGYTWSSRVLPTPADYNPSIQLARLSPEAAGTSDPGKRLVMRADERQAVISGGGSAGVFRLAHAVGK